MMDKPNILIVKLSAIGDVIHTLPAVNALRRRYPNAHIEWLVEEEAAGLLEGHTALDGLLISRRKTWLKRTCRRRNTYEALLFLKDLRSRRYDMVFDFQAAFKGAILIALVRARRKIGFGRGLKHQELSYLVLNERIPAVSMEIHALDRNTMMTAAVGIPCPVIEYGLPIGDKHRLQAQRLLTENGIDWHKAFVTVNPKAKWDSKLWQQHRFACVADRIQTEFNMPVIFTGGPEDKMYVKAIQDQMETNAAHLAGRTDLLTLAALLQRTSLMITTDTGPMHIAAAVGTPTIALFGPTAPWRTGPHGNGHRVLQAGRPCSPCFKRRCPLGRDCMSLISVENVIAAAADLLVPAN